MTEQMSLFDVPEYETSLLFSEEEINNEQEEDVSKSGIDHIGQMAIAGTDWTTETIVSQIEKGNIILDPDFQRRDAWSLSKKSKFIESLILGFPIPQIVLAETREKKGKFIVIDGKQRLLSLQQFMSNDLKNQQPMKLSNLEVRKELNGKTYYQMLHDGFSEDIDALSNQPIRTVVVKNWPSIEVLYLIFLRLNTGSVKLSPQELRQALYPGEFIRYANNSAAESEAIRKMLNVKSNKLDFRMRDVEIFIRYMAFQFFAKDYTGSMQAFLDQTCENLNKQWSKMRSMVELKTKELEQASKCTYSIFGNDAFHKYKATKYERKMNRAIIDIMLYYFSDELIRNKALSNPNDVKHAFELLCQTDDSFIDAIEQTTKSMAAVTCRFQKWSEALTYCLDIQVQSPFREA